MRMPRWNFDRDRSAQHRYALTDTDREYIQTKRRSEHPANDPEDRIQEKIDNLPDRIHDLLLDIAILQADDRFDEETWKYVLGEKGQSRYPINTLTDVDLSLQEKLQPTITLGYQLGIVMESLYSPVDVEIDPELRHEYKLELDSVDRSQWEDLVWGFALAYLGRADNYLEKEEQSLEELIEHLRKRMADRIDEQSGKVNEAAENDWIEAQAKTEEAISEQIVEYDLEPTPGAVRVLREQVPTDPIQSPDNFQQLFEELLEKTPFEEINTVESAANQDIDYIEVSAPQSVAADKVFEVIINKISRATTYQSDKTVTKEEIGDQLPEENQKNTTQVLRSFGKQYDHHRWPERKILEERDGGWGLTNYGSLISYSYFERQKSTVWMYDPYLHAERGMTELKEFTIPALEEFFDDYYDPYWAYFYGSA